MALQEHALTQRFLDEAACDTSGLILVQSALANTGQRISREARLDIVESILLAAYRTFLNMRFTTYFGQVVRVRLEDGDGPINPVIARSVGITKCHRRGSR